MLSMSMYWFALTLFAKCRHIHRERSEFKPNIIILNTEIAFNTLTQKSQNNLEKKKPSYGLLEAARVTAKTRKSILNSIIF